MRDASTISKIKETIDFLTLTLQFDLERASKMKSKSIRSEEMHLKILYDSAKWISNKLQSTEKGNDKSSMEVERLDSLSVDESLLQIPNTICQVCSKPILLENDPRLLVGLIDRCDCPSTIRKCLGFDVCGNRLVLSGDYCGPCLDTQIANTMRKDSRVEIFIMDKKCTFCDNQTRVCIIVKGFPIKLCWECAGILKGLIKDKEVEQK